MDSCARILSDLYGVYVEFVSKNALIEVDAPINNELFRGALQEYVTGLPGFA